jgi:hypothetical protein
MLEMWQEGPQELSMWEVNQTKGIAYGCGDGQEE